MELTREARFLYQLDRATSTKIPARNDAQPVGRDSSVVMLQQLDEVWIGSDFKVN